MDSIKEYLNLNYLRRFGAEIEINAFDMRNRPIGYEDGILPDGIYYVGNLVQKTTGDNVLIHKWGHDHNNDIWIVKPDASCGMEVCSPVSKGWQGIVRICKVIQAFYLDKKIIADDRCSFHLHVDVSDLDEFQIAKIVSWWIKCEPVFMDSVPSKRKNNQYCQFIGQTDIFEKIEDSMPSPESLIKRLGGSKYYTLNTYHYCNKKRKTIEFRIMDNACCLDPWMAKNWMRLVLHFVEMSLKNSLPCDYEVGNKWSGYCWLDPIDVFDFLGFNSGELSLGLKQVRSWFLSRLVSQSKNTGLKGVMSDSGRLISHEQIDYLQSQIETQLEFNNEDLYSHNFRV
jgi:hypothetical protein